LGSDAIEDHLALRAEEEMAEALRLLYVAVTRAKHHCYLVWVPLPSAADSAQAYLLYGDRDMGQDGDFRTMMQSSARAFQRRDGHAQRRDIAALARRSDGTIAVDDLPADLKRGAGRPERSPLELASRRFERALDGGWKMASFSSLIHGRHEEGEIRDDLMVPESDASGDLREPETGLPQETIGAIAGFEASVQAGLFFHELLERIDFHAPDPMHWQPLIENLLERHRFDPQWHKAVADLLRRIMHTPLAPDTGKSFALHQISADHRLNELEFHLPLGAVDAAALARAFEACRQPAFQGRLPTLMAQLDFQLSGGYLKGFIDLVLRHGNRYYIVDWKSNYLGDTFEAYHPARLVEAMQSDFYFLQYHIYLLAWDQYMRTCRADYRYERDFGGVFYLFIRGMEPSRPSSGIFFDRPGPELLRGLRQALMISD
jgi:exodeoxyribonuclease V beta subunit